jgi:VanZ family protein
MIALGWIWAIAIVSLSLMPAPPEIDLEQGDKLGHFAGYGILMLCFAVPYPSRNTRLGYAAGFIAMGIGLELAQGALGYRHYDAFDMLANALGVLIGWALAAGASRIRPR